MESFLEEGYEAELRGAKHQLLAAVQHVLSGPADVAGAGARTQASRLHIR